MGSGASNSVTLPAAPLPAPKAWAQLLWPAGLGCLPRGLTLETRHEASTPSALGPSPRLLLGNAFPVHLLILLFPHPSSLGW